MAISIVHLPVEICCNILVFVCDYSTLVKVGSVSKHFRRIVFSDSCSYLWNRDPKKQLIICVDDYCPICSLAKFRVDNYSAYSFIRICPIQRISLHCFIECIPDILASIKAHNTITELNLKLSNRSGSPSLEYLLKTCEVYREKLSDQLILTNLKALTLDSSHLNHINLAGRALLLEIIGGSLMSLSFVGLSPRGVFSIISSRCPQLRHLRVDKAISANDFLNYRNEFLEHLELCRSHFCLSEPLPFPHLINFKFTASFKLECSQVRSMINFVPKSVQRISLELPSAFINESLIALSMRLSNLKSVFIEGSYGSGSISRNTLHELGVCCGQFLEHFEIHCLKYVDSLTFDLEALSAFSYNFPKLKLLRMMYEEYLLDELPHLLRSVQSLKQLVLKARKKWISQRQWNVITEKLKRLNYEFPNTDIFLQNID